MTKRISEKVGSLTQRLDHMVPDPKISDAANRAAARELKMLTDALYGMLPDRSLSPAERIERLARAVDDRTPKPEHLRPAHIKLEELRARIDELVPGEGSAFEKILSLEANVDEKVGAERGNMALIRKLELLGDAAGRVEPE